MESYTANLREKKSNAECCGDYKLKRKQDEPKLIAIPNGEGGTCTALTSCSHVTSPNKGSGP